MIAKSRDRAPDVPFKASAPDADPTCVDLIFVENPNKPDERVKRLRLMDEKTRKRGRGVDSNQYLRDLFAFNG
jgi:hypothetical protein